MPFTDQDRQYADLNKSLNISFAQIAQLRRDNRHSLREDMPECQLQVTNNQCGRCYVFGHIQRDCVEPQAARLAAMLQYAV